MPPAVRAKRNPSSHRSTATVNLRIPQQTRELIDSAAAAVGKSRTEFMLESARREAIDVLLDQRFLTLDTEQYEAFMRVLDNPPPLKAKLKRLLATKAPWER